MQYVVFLHETTTRRTQDSIRFRYHEVGGGVRPQVKKFKELYSDVHPFTPSVSVNALMTLSILFSLKTESLENGLQIHSGVTLLFSMRTESQASSQRWLLV